MNSFLEYKNKDINELANLYLQTISSLNVQYKFPFFDQAVNAIKFLRRNSWTEQQIVDKVGQDLHSEGLDPHSIRRIYQKSFGRPLPDDFEFDNIFAVKVLNTQTVQITVEDHIEGVEEGSFVQFDDQDWQVLAMHERDYVIKRIK